jgi:hypothetical protein
MIDLAGVCARHGISLVLLTGMPLRPLYRAADDDLEEAAGTAGGAVCALLKARHGITVRPTPTRQNADRWTAYTNDGSREAESGPTELAAVVALADRLAGAQP